MPQTAGEGVDGGGVVIVFVHLSGFLPTHVGFYDKAPKTNIMNNIVFSAAPGGEGRGGGRGRGGRSRTYCILHSLFYIFRSCFEFSMVLIGFVFVFGFSPGFRDWHIKGSKASGITKTQKPKQHPKTHSGLCKNQEKKALRH